jgi:ribokinase
LPTRRPAILSLGSINADFQIRVPRRPEVSETLVGEGFVRLGGGKGANVAVLAARMGMPAVLLGRVGDDDLAEQALAPLRSAGVDLAGVTRAVECATGLSVITVPPDGKKGIVLAPNANDQWDDDAVGTALDVIERAPEGSALVADCEVPVAVVEAALERAGEAGIARILDPSPAERVSDRMLRATDVIVPNPVEAQTLTGVDVADAGTARDAARALFARGPAAAVKLPDGGCVLFDGAEVLRLETPEVEVVDTTGAGDAFAGALAVGLADGRSLTEAARLAVAVASHAVTDWGSQPAYPDRALAERLAERVTLRRME